jgi:hypothetical protein
MAVKADCLLPVFPYKVGHTLVQNKVLKFRTSACMQASNLKKESSRHTANLLSWNNGNFLPNVFVQFS